VGNSLDSKYSTCGECREWTPPKFLVSVMFDQREEWVCISCKDKIDKREQELEDLLAQHQAAGQNPGQPI
jgi:hypothetical protein